MLSKIRVCGGCAGSFIAGALRGASRQFSFTAGPVSVVREKRFCDPTMLFFSSKAVRADDNAKDLVRSGAAKETSENATSVGRNMEDGYWGVDPVEVVQSLRRKRTKNDLDIRLAAAIYLLHVHHQKDAVKLILACADQGHALSQYHIGCLYAAGFALPKDMAMASKYLEMAAEGGCVEAKAFYGRLLLGGINVRDSSSADIVAKAVKYLRSGAEAGNTRAECLYGEMLLHGHGVEQHPALAGVFLKRAADKGDKIAAWWYSDLLIDGQGVKKDMKEAAKYSKMASDKGVAAAMFNYVVCMDEAGRPEESEKYLKMSADGGYSPAILQWTRKLMREDLEGNKAECLSLVRKAAIDPNPASMFWCAELLLDLGEPHESIAQIRRMTAKSLPLKDLARCAMLVLNRMDEVYRPEGLTCLKRAADEGDVQSQVVLGSWYWNGEKVEQNKIEARKSMRKAAESGSVEAQVSLGMMLGEEERMFGEAVNWFKKAADQGNAQGMLNYGIRQVLGKGVEVNQSEGIRYLEMASEKGEPSGERVWAVAEMTEGGNELERADGFRRLRRLADERNDAGSSFAVAFAYARGIGVSQSDEVAERYLRTAARQGHKLSHDLLDKCKVDAGTCVGQLLRDMDPRQIHLYCKSENLNRP